MTTKIELKSMRFYAYHGVDPQETRVGNWFIVDLMVTVDLVQAIEMITWIVQLIMQRYMRLLSRK